MGTEIKKNTTGSDMILKKIFTVLGVVIIALLITLIIVSIINDPDIRRSKYTLNEYIVATSIKELGKTNSKKDRVSHFDEIDNIKRIFLNIDEGLNDEKTLDRCVFNTIQVMKKLVKDDEFMSMQQDGISFQWVIDVIDSYGSTKQDVGCIITFKKDEIKKIQWDTVTVDGIKKVAYTFWVNPAF